MFVVVSGCW